MSRWTDEDDEFLARHTGYLWGKIQKRAAERIWMRLLDAARQVAEAPTVLSQLMGLPPFEPPVRCPVCRYEATLIPTFWDWLLLHDKPVTNDQARRALDICLLDEGHQGPHEFDAEPVQNSAQNPGIRGAE